MRPHLLKLFPRTVGNRKALGWILVIWAFSHSRVERDALLLISFICSMLNLSVPSTSDVKKNRSPFLAISNCRATMHCMVGPAIPFLLIPAPEPVSEMAAGNRSMSSTLLKNGRERWDISIRLNNAKQPHQRALKLVDLIVIRKILVIWPLHSYHWVLCTVDRSY